MSILSIKKSHLTNLGKAVKHYRKLKGISQEKFARSIGLHRTYIGAIEQGRQNLTFSKVILLADGLNVHLFELLDFMR